jgi:hypothetical protein
MSGSKDDLLNQSGPLPLPRAIVDASSPVEAQILVMLNDQNVSKERTNEIIFGKLDELGTRAQTAAMMAEAAHAEAVGIKDQINQKFTELNGKIAATKLDVEMLKAKDGERTAEALRNAIEQKAVETVSTGVWMMPKPTWRQLAVMGSVIAFIGIDRLTAVIKTLMRLASDILSLGH